MGCNCNKRPTNPSTTTKPFNVVDAVTQTLTGTATYAAEDCQNMRKAICSTCEFYRSMINQCSKCGCIVLFKVKYVQSTCPMDKW